MFIILLSTTNYSNAQKSATNKVQTGGAMVFSILRVLSEGPLEGRACRRIQILLHHL